MGQMSCKNCSTGTYVSEERHPGKTPTDCRACPYGKSKVSAKHSKFLGIAGGRFRREPWILVKKVLKFAQQFSIPVKEFGKWKESLEKWLLFFFQSYNLGQNCWENCILGQHFSKHRSCTGSSLSPFPWKQCCCVFKRKPDPWAFVGSNIELGEGVFFPQRRRFRNSFVA